MLMTVLHYGESDDNDKWQPGQVRILNCLTRQFSQEVVKDPSGVDTEYVRTTLTVQGYLRVNGARSLHIGEPGPANPHSPTSPPNRKGPAVTPSHFENITQQRHAIERILNSPRQPLKYGFTANTNGDFLETFGVQGRKPQIFFEAYPPTEETDITSEDVNNGPFCQSWRIIDIAGGELAKIEATFVACRVDCSSSNNSAGILSNRWSVRDTIDKDWYTTRTWTGRLACASNKLNPHTLRGYCLPTLQPGLRRESMDFDVATDGKTLSYTIVDREVAFAAPPPATSWEVSHRIETSDSKMVHASIRVALKGHRNSNKKDLLAIGMELIYDKLIGRPGQQNQAIINHIAATDIISSEQPVTMMIECDAQTIRTQEPELLFSSQKIGRPIDENSFNLPWLQNYNNNLSRVPEGNGLDPEGVSGPITLLGAVTTYFQTPCNDSHGCTETAYNKPLTQKSPNDNPIPEIQPSIRIVPEVWEQYPTWASVEHTEAPYTEYRIQSTYDTPQGRVHLPVAESWLEQENEGISEGDSGGSYSDGPDAVTFDLSRPASVRVIRVRAERLGQWPQLMEPESILSFVVGAVEARLLQQKVVAQEPFLTPEGGTIYTIDAQYRYGMDIAHRAGMDLPVGLDPSQKGSVSIAPASIFTSFQEGTEIP